MSDKESISLKSIERFTELISSGQDSEQAIGEAFLSVSKPLGIGRVTGNLEVPAGKTQKHPVSKRIVFFTSDDGFDRNVSVTSEYPTENGGTFTITASAIPGISAETFADSCIMTLLNITNLHFGRSYLSKKAEESLMVQMLTGLPNVNGYMREAGKKYVMGTIESFDAYYFNLRGFGLISKRFGQREGNEIMIRLTEELQKFFTEDELLGHLGGDNFVALVKKGSRSEAFRAMLKEGIPTFARSDGKEVPLKIPAVAGWMAIEMPCPVDRVIGGPAVALSWAKRTKQPAVQLTEELNEQVNRSKAIEQGFQKSLANKEFTVFYQPKVNSVTGKIIGAEALTRWFENGRMISPMVFIPVLEQTGQITELDLAMLELVCQDISAWKKQGNQSVPASVNFSRRDLSDPKLPEKILGIINKYGIKKDEIVIEITETASEEEQSQMATFLNLLKEYGIESSIDDFGTGYSSLSVLREFPVGEIKIDRSFINRELGSSDEIIIQSIIDMAGKLNIEVITEGVEYVEQKDFLHRLGCDRIQGFLYDQPLPKDKFEQRMKEGYYKV